MRAEKINAALSVSGTGANRLGDGGGITPSERGSDVPMRRLKKSWVKGILREGGPRSGLYLMMPAHQIN